MGGDGLGLLRRCCAVLGFFVVWVAIPLIVLVVSYTLGVYVLLGVWYLLVWVSTDGVFIWWLTLLLWCL